VLREYDLRRANGSLRANILRALGLNNFESWCGGRKPQTNEIASLAPGRFRSSAEERTKAARQIIAAGVSALVDFTTDVSCGFSLRLREVRLMGGLSKNSEIYEVAFAKAISEKIPVRR